MINVPIIIKIILYYNFSTIGFVLDIIIYGTQASTGGTISRLDVTFTLSFTIRFNALTIEIFTYNLTIYILS